MLQARYLAKNIMRQTMRNQFLSEAKVEPGIQL